MKSILNQLLNIQYHDKSSIISKDVETLIQTTDDTQKRQIIHKLNRIIVEFNFVAMNNKKYISLTSREKEVIFHLVKGDNNPDIAEKLFISRRTVEQHRKNINRKLEITCFVQLVTFAYAFNLI